MRQRLIVGAFLVWMACWAIFALTGCSKVKDCKSWYRLPDGTLCGTWSEYHGHMKFWRCNNGREYLDPAWWKYEEECK